MGDAIALCARASDNAAWTVHHFNNLSSVARLNVFSSAHTNLILSEDIVIKLIVDCGVVHFERFRVVLNYS